MNQVSKIKILWIAITTAFLFIVNTVLYSNLELPFNELLIVIIISVLIITFLFFRSNSYFINLASNNDTENYGIDPFVVYVSRLINIDKHYSIKERIKVEKHLKKLYGWYMFEIKLFLIDSLVNKEKQIHLNKSDFVKYPDRNDNLKLLQKLIRVALSDKFLSNNEKEFLIQTTERLELSNKDLEFILSRYDYVSEEETEYQRKLKNKPNYGFQKAYSILGLTANATLTEVKKAYRDLAKIYHPDKQKGKKVDAELARTQFQIIAQAYELIKDSRGN